MRADAMPPLVTPASGCGGTGPELARFGDPRALPALMLGPVGLPPAAGAERVSTASTVVESTAASLVYRHGPALPVTEVCDQWLPWLRARDARAVVAVPGEASAVLADILGRLRRSVDLGALVAVEVDLSAPQASSDPQHCLRVMSRTRELLPRDVGRHAKFDTRSPDLIGAARHAVAGGATALVLSGATPVGTAAAMAGPAVLPITVALVSSVREAIDQGRVPPVPLIGVGGVGDEAGARRLLEAGASGVQVGTALFTDPGVLWRLTSDLAPADRDRRDQG